MTNRQPKHPVPILRAAERLVETANGLADRCPYDYASYLVGTAQEIFALVAEAVGRMVPAAEVAFVGRYDLDGVAFVGGWSRRGEPRFVGDRVSVGGDNVATRVFETGKSARVDPPSV